MVPGAKSPWSVLIQRFCSKYVPIFRANIASIVRWDTTAIDNDSQNHKSDTSSDFHGAEYEFDLTQVRWSHSCSSAFTDLSIALDSEILDDREKEEQWDDPSAVVNVLCAFPVVDNLNSVSPHYSL